MGRFLDLLFALFCSKKPASLPTPSPVSDQQDSPPGIPDALRPFLPANMQPTDSVIILRVRQEDLAEMDKLVRYFEAPYEGLILRGLKLMDLIRAIGIHENQKLCVVQMDEESGQIVGIQDIVIN